jgi:formate hydrogenlyase subunit 3/multisubunit Na+/H+ antiporter MnhD subunit
VFYLRLISVMFLNDPLSAARPAGGRPALAGVLVAAVLVVAFGVYPRPVFDFLQRPDYAAETASLSTASDRPLVEHKGFGPSTGEQ